MMNVRVAAHGLLSRLWSSYLVLGFSGLVLVMQPVPGWSGRVREAHP